MSRTALPDRKGGGRLPTRSVPVVGLLALLLVLLAVLASLYLWRGYREALELGQTRVISASRTAAAHVRWLMEANLQALARVDAALVLEDGTLSAGEPEEFATILRALPEGTSLSVVDAAGKPLMSSDTRYMGGTVAQREYFHAVRDGREWHVSPLLIGQATGRKVFAVARRVERDGRFLGAVISVVPIEVMAQFWNSLDLGPDSSVGLLREDGWLVARHPAPENTIDLSGYVLFTDYLPRSPSGVYDAVSPADGVVRIVAYQKIEELPLVAVVGVARDWVLARFHERARAMALVGVPLALGLVGMSVGVAVLLRRDEAGRRRDAEMNARLAQALEHNRMLVREAYHRVKNNLQAVASMLQLGPGTPETKADMLRRIGAMAALHEQLYTSDSFEAVRMDEYVGATVARLREAHPDGAELVCALDPLEVPADQALPLGMIVSEVVSNALKHAFEDGRRGTVRIGLGRAGPGRAVLTVADDGRGFVPDPARGGLGMRLVQAFAQQVGGEASFRSDGGTRFTLEFPV